MKEQILIIMQGAPGSGKSWLAEHIRVGLASAKHHCYVCSTDDFFVDLQGQYKFEKDKLARNHEWNRERVRCLLIYGASVIVSNTNTRAGEARPYVEMAVSLNIPVAFIRCEGRFPNVHGVHPDLVERMRERMEPLSVELCLAAKPLTPRQPREDLPTELDYQI